MPLRRELVSGKLPKDGYLLGELEIRQIIETYAEDEAIFTAVRCKYKVHSTLLFSHCPCLLES